VEEGVHDRQSHCALRGARHPARAVVPLFLASDQEVRRDWLRSLVAGLVKQGYPGVVLGYTVAIEFAGALLLLLGVYTRYVSSLSLPVLIAVANHWMVRKGFWFADGGMEFPLAWVFMLIAQVLLGDGACALRVPALPWKRRQPATA
jgi:uncharacterized membrane protein YphA (DoxX/SURF4 family)